MSTASEQLEQATKFAQHPVLRENYPLVASQTFHVLEAYLHSKNNLHTRFRKEDQLEMKILEEAVKRTAEYEMDKKISKADYVRFIVDIISESCKYKIISEVLGKDKFKVLHRAAAVAAMNLVEIAYQHGMKEVILRDVKNRSRGRNMADYYNGVTEETTIDPKFWKGLEKKLTTRTMEFC